VRLGARVIATTTSAAKVRALEAFGPHAIVDTRHEPYVDRVKEITGGAGARRDLRPGYGPLVNDHIRAACREAVVFVYGALDPTPLTLELGGMLRKQIRLQGYTIGRSSATRAPDGAVAGRLGAARARRVRAGDRLVLPRSTASRMPTAASSRTSRSGRSSSRREREMSDTPPRDAICSGYVRWAAV
jgi:NADPH:quinone reductase-like Zn-dependent oxidoreductase